MNDDSKLHADILWKAEAESADIIRKAEKSAEMKRKGLEARKTAIREDIDRKIDEKTSQIEKLTESAVASEGRRRSLRKREELNQAVIELVLKKAAERCGSGEWDDFTAKLIAEGIAAIGENQVKVTTMRGGSLSGDVLERAAELVKARTGEDVVISLDEQRKLASPGVRVEGVGGRLAYSNTVESRLRRFDDQVRQIIFTGIGGE